MTANAPITAALVATLAASVLTFRAALDAPEPGCARCKARGRNCGHARGGADCLDCSVYGVSECPAHGERAAAGGYRVRFVLPDRAEAMRAKVKRLAKRAAVLGMDPPALVEAPPVAVPYVDDHGRRSHQLRVPVVATGESPRLNGWSFVARIDHAAELNLVSKARDVPLPGRFWTAPADCEHCAVRRRRTRTFVLTDGHRLVQVGASCLADFLGHPDPDHFAAWGEWEAMLGEADEDDCFGAGRGGATVYALVEFLSYVADVIATVGWVPASKADLATPSTASVAFARMIKGKPFVTVDAADAEARAAEVIAWVRSLWGDGSPATVEALNDYHRNLIAAFITNRVEFKTSGLIASAYASQQRAASAALAKTAPAVPSVHFGTVGKREAFTFTVIRVFDGASDWGGYRIHILRDDAGNIARWKSTGGWFEVGDRVTGKATVKAHNDYRGTAQTDLTRCAFERAPATDSAPTGPTAPRGYLTAED